MLQGTHTHLRPILPQIPSTRRMRAARLADTTSRPEQAVVGLRVGRRAYYVLGRATPFRLGQLEHIAEIITSAA